VIERPPVTVGQRDWDRGLLRMVLASGALHLVAIALLVLIPHSFLHQPPPLRSYTVDLVSPDKLGGNNLMAGGKGRVNAAPLAAQPKLEPPKPPPPKMEPKVDEKPPEPPAPKEPEKPKPEEAANKPEPPPQPPKSEEKRAEDALALAQPAAPTAPPPMPTAPPAPSPPAKPAPSPQAKPAASPKVIAKAEPPKAPPTIQPKPNLAAPKETAAAREALAAKARDERIAAAVKRVEQQTGKRGGGSGSESNQPAGGPISVGPGEGAGGTVKGVEYLLYYNQVINRIKQTWAWAGADRSLEAAVRFSISESGDVLDVRITHPSGDAGFDRSVERAVRAASPLPPPPDTYRKEFSDVELTFRPEDFNM
jgi:TonB family protein